MSDTNATTNPTLTPQECIRLFIAHRRLWLLPTVGCAVLSLVYALFMTRYWEAIQGMVVRDEASSTSLKQPGKFADLYEMRTFQETILEVAKSHQVLSATLRAAAGDQDYEPTPTDIEKFRKRLTMTPPNGAEFGKTEVFYLGVKDPDRARAIQLVTVLCQELGHRLGELRNQRSQGLIDEFQRQVDSARQLYEAENAALEVFESQVGPDLGELRLLHSATGGQSDLRQQVVEAEKEQRRNEARIREAEDLLTVLKEAQSQPEKLVALPSSLLSFQPTLQRLKDGLVDAQLQASRLAGTRTADHPYVKAAQEAVAHISSELHSELQVAIEGLKVELSLSRNRHHLLASQLSELQERLGRLADLRAEYSSRVASVESSRSVLNQLRRQLSEVQAKQVASQSAKLVTPIDAPETGPHPIGLGRTTVVGVGTFGGFALGVAWLFLSVAPSTVNSATRVVEQTTAAETDSAHGPIRPTAGKPVRQKFDFSEYVQAARQLAGLENSNGNGFSATANSH